MHSYKAPVDLLQGLQGHTTWPEGAEHHYVPSCLPESTEEVSNSGLLVMSSLLGSLKDVS